MMKRSYMKSSEFKERQTWLPFVDAVGIALEVMSEKLFEFRQWFKSWKPKEQKRIVVNRAKWLFIELGGIQPYFMS
jgi:hypothetical protein